MGYKFIQQDPNEVDAKGNSTSVAIKAKGGSQITWVYQIGARYDNFTL